MPTRFQKTLSIGLSSLLAFGGFGTACWMVNAAETGKRVPNVLHEMVPHVVLPETIQYDKSVKPLPGSGKSYPNAASVASYTAFPSYQIPAAAEFRPVEQNVYPVSPAPLPAPLPNEKKAEENEPADTELTAPKQTAWTTAKKLAGDTAGKITEGKDIRLTDKPVEPIQLAANDEALIPVLPAPDSTITQTGIFCQHPATPPSAWSFSSPLFKVASVPAGWGGQTGYINHTGPKGYGTQTVGFAPYGQPAGSSPANPDAAALPPGLPYSTFQMGGSERQAVPQTYILPNGMILLTLPPDHTGCGMIRCRANHQPRTMLLPPAPPMQNVPPAQGAMQSMMMPNMMQPGMMPGMIQNTAMFSGTRTMPFVPVTVMTPMGPAVAGYQQAPMMPPSFEPASWTAAIQSPLMPTIQQVQASVAPAAPAAGTAPGSATTSAGEPSAETAAELKTPAMLNAPLNAGQTQPLGVIATPYGFFAVQPQVQPDGQTPAEANAVPQPLPQMIPQMMPQNPYMYAVPYGYAGMPQHLGYGGLPVMNAGYQMMPAGMPGFGQAPMGQPQMGLGIADVVQLITLLNANNKPRRQRLMDRIAERRENRLSSGGDPLAQLMQAWTTPYVSPDMTLRQPARNAYPYGYFGAVPQPVSTANYGGYHNFYMGNTSYPGQY